MKKSLVFLALAASIASVNLQAQEQTGGASSSAAATGAVTGGVIAAGTVAAVIAVGLVANTNGNSPEIIDPVDPVDPVDPPLTCNGDDALVDGVCINNSVTTTVTGTGTATSTITVPVSFTYAPTN